MLRSVHARILVIALLGVVGAFGNSAPGDAAVPGVNEARRHGAIESDTGKPRAEGTAIPNPTDVALSSSEIRRGFDRLSGGGSTWAPH
jgi:hypothetical protein